MAALEEALRTAPPRPSEAIRDHLLSTLLGDTYEDDACLFVVRCCRLDPDYDPPEDSRH
jgi:hypothetical protein